MQVLDANYQNKMWTNWYNNVRRPWIRLCSDICRILRCSCKSHAHRIDCHRGSIRPSLNIANQLYLTDWTSEHQNAHESIKIWRKTDRYISIRWEKLCRPQLDIQGSIRIDSSAQLHDISCSEAYTGDGLPHKHPPKHSNFTCGYH